MDGESGTTRPTLDSAPDSFTPFFAEQRQEAVTTKKKAARKSGFEQKTEDRERAYRMYLDRS
jgi:hypothetical protein